MNLAAHKLFRNGKEVDLTAKEFRLLAYFLSRRGCALTRAGHLARGVGQLGDGDAAQHRPLRGDAAGEDRAGRRTTRNTFRPSATSGIGSSRGRIEQSACSICGLRNVEFSERV